MVCSFTTYMLNSELFSVSKHHSKVLYLGLAYYVLYSDVITRETPQLRLSCLINTACTTGYTDFLLLPPELLLPCTGAREDKNTAISIHQFPQDQLSMASFQFL